MSTLSPGRHGHAPPAAPRTAPVHVYTLPGRPTGRFLAVLTGARADSDVAAHADALTAAGHYGSAVVVLPARTNPYHRLSARTLARLAARTGAATVITSVPVHPPGPHLTPSTATASRIGNPPPPFTLPRR
ncbi:hypothetical protein [Streptomyces sp. NPDC058739]|uniref:hypothetical protein n=1 Tax=Streptomyces sp. NPDC058739 TaxID=3346618 RepID=UPI0036C9AEA1